MKEWGKCPDCGCNIFNVQSIQTADMPYAWKDDDGKWYYGCAKETSTKSCAHCGKSQRLVYVKGKLESIN